METNKINLKNEINEISEKFGDSSIVLGIEQSTYIDFFRLTEFLHINHMFRQSENLNFCLGEFYQISNNYICSIKGFLTSINYLKKRSSSVLWYEKKYFSFIYQFPPNSLRSTSNRYFIDNSQELPNLVLMVKTRNSVQINILQKSIKKRNFLLLPDLIIRKEEKKLSNISLIVDRQLKHSNCANYFYDNNTNEDIIQTEFKINPKLSSGLDVIDYYKYFTSNTIARYRQEKGIDNWWKNINNKNERNLNVLGKNLNYESEMNYYYVSEQQLCRPLAFSILVHEEFEQLERFILSIYQPQHLYCIHVDNKMERLLFYLTAKLFARNFHNIIVIDRREDVEWGEFSLLKAHLNCFEELRKYSNGLNGMKKFSLTSQLKNYIEQIPCGTISWQYVIPCTFQTVNLLPMMEMSRMFYDENNGKISLYCHCGRDTLKFLIYRLFGENEMALNAKFKDNVIYTNCSLAISNEFYEFKLRKEIREKFPEISLFFFRYHIIYVATNVQKNETFIVSLAKSSLYVGLRREFVNFIFDNPFAQRFFQFLSHMFISDEIIFQSLLCECLKVESKLHSMFINRYRLYINSKNRCAGNKSMNFEKKKYFNVWKKDNYSSLKASSTNQMRTSFSLWNSDICAKIVHGVCIGTIRDLYWISRVKTAFFNKIKFNIDVLAFECLEERRINRTIIPSKYPVGNLGQITFS
ncbi:hypothetical protein SNEBB_008702 [Seison nebaliae]|nr:hypothetical protein SNEBB_008702 [Seison nebaliae]